MTTPNWHSEELEDGRLVICLDEPDWHGVKVMFGKVNFIEEEDSAYCTCSFLYEILEPGKYTREELRDSEDFAFLLGKIMEQLLTEAASQGVNSVSELSDGPNQPTSLE